jgi:hypothetical protein
VFFNKSHGIEGFTNRWLSSYPKLKTLGSTSTDPFFVKLANAAAHRATVHVIYDGSYLQIPYPGGDVPSNLGVCTDEVIRAYRLVGIDLQKEVHEDMVRAFVQYPKIWQLSKPDPNIDHRRVPNLMTFFLRHGITLSIESNPKLYFPGDLVVWRLSDGLLHIGMVVSQMSTDGRRPLIMHNIGTGPKIEDALYVGKIIGHFRYKK